MSWQTYVDKHIVGTGDATSGMIAGLEGSTWASSPDLNGKVSTTEIQNIVKAFTNPEDAYINGLQLAGERWRIVKVDKEDGWIHLKKDSMSAHAIKTNKAVLIAVNDGKNDNMSDGKTSTCVQKLGDYLKDKQF